MHRPLADEIRPKTLDDVVGQQHLLGKNGLLRRVSGICWRPAVFCAA